MSSHEHPYITIVSGLPRSGTSMMMQMLEAGGMAVLCDHLRAADDDNPRGYYELEAVKKTRLDSSWIKDAPGKAVKVIHHLLTDLPSNYCYRVIFMERDLEEVLKSQSLMLGRLGRTGATLSTEALRGAFVGQLRRVEEWLTRQSNFQVMKIGYAEVLNQPRPAAERINSFLGGNLSTDAMSRVVTPTLYRNHCSESWNVE